MSARHEDPRACTLEHVLEPAFGTTTAGPTIVRGLIADLLDTGEIDVVVPPNADSRIRCDFLDSATNAGLELHPGDRVLVMLPTAPGQNGCVLGRIGAYRPPQPHVVIEAGEMLTLKCGDSSVDLRKDGKLMIRGNDVLSRAKRTQRIKGGTVAIN